MEVGQALSDVEMPLPKRSISRVEIKGDHFWQDVGLQTLQDLVLST